MTINLSQRRHRLHRHRIKSKAVGSEHRQNRRQTIDIDHGNMKTLTLNQN
jgi:hypothetical protein